MSLKEKIENKWYDFVDYLDGYIPIGNAIDKVDNYFPSVIIPVILFLIILLLIIFSLSNLAFINNFEVEVIVLSINNTPLENVNLSITDGENIIEKITDKSGKAIFLVNEEKISISAKKDGYLNKIQGFENIKQNDKLIISLNEMPAQFQNLAVLIVDEENKIIKGAQIEILCNTEIRNVIRNQSDDGFVFEAEENCNNFRVSANAKGYEEKTVSFLDGDQRIVISLNKIKEDGEVFFKLINNNGEAVLTEINIKDEIGQTKTIFTDSFGEVLSKLNTGNYTYVITSELGEQKSGSFEIISGKLTEILVRFDLSENGKYKYLNFKVMNNSGEIVPLTQFYLFKNAAQFGALQRRTNAEFERKISDNTISQTDEFVAYFSADSYEDKIIEVMPKESEEFVEVKLDDGGAKLNLTIYDDLNELVQGAFIEILNKNYEFISKKAYSNPSGEVVFDGIASGNYIIKASSSNKIDYFEKEISISKNEIINLTIYLSEGTGNIDFEISDIYNKKLDLENKVFVDSLKSLQNSINGRLRINDVKANSKITLEIDNNNYFNYESLEYKVLRGNQKKEIKLREINDTLNDKELQLILNGVYSSNPIYSTSSSRNINRLIDGQKYYFEFDLLINTEEEIPSKSNFEIILDQNYLTSPVRLANIYSIKNSLTKENESGLEIEHLSQNGKKQIPIIVELEIDENFSEGFILEYGSISSNYQSLDYKKEFVIGESFCISDCDLFYFDNFLIWGENRIPVTERQVVLLGEEYTLETIIHNTTDQKYTNLEFVNEIRKNYLDSITLNNDSNTSKSIISLDPFEKSIKIENKLNLKKQSSALIEQKVKSQNLNLEGLRGTENELNLRIKNKEKIKLGFSPQVIYAGAKYPFFAITTGYQNSNKLYSMFWKIEKEVSGERVELYSGQTDENGISKIMFDATNLSVSDKLFISAFDLNANIPIEEEIEITEFIIVETESHECLIVSINGSEFTINNSIINANINESKSFTITSNCEEKRRINLHTDILLNKKIFDIEPGATENIVVTAKPRDNLLGVYPVQVMSEEGYYVKQIALIDFIIRDPADTFSLERFIFDLRNKNEINSEIINNSYSGRKDLFHPKVDISTNSVFLTHDKSGIPKEINAKVKVTGSGIESFVGALIRSEKIGAINYRPQWGSDLVYGYPNGPFLVDEAELFCDDSQWDGKTVLKEEPKLDDIKQNQVIVPDTSNTLKSEERKISGISFAQKDAPILSYFTPEAGDRGNLASDIDFNTKTIKKVNTFPTRSLLSEHRIEFYWDKKHDYFGNSALHAPRPGNYIACNSKEECERNYGAAVGPDEVHYLVTESYGKDRGVYYAGMQNISGEANPVYIELLAKGDRDRDIGGTSHETAEIALQVDFLRGNEYFVQRSAFDYVDVNLKNPIEGAWYDFGVYEADPAPEWVGEKRPLFDKKVGDDWTEPGSYALYTLMCASAQGFVAPEWVEEKTSSETEERKFKVSDYNSDLIEYEPNGIIKYEIYPEDIPDVGMRFVLNNGKLYGQYIGNVKYDEKGNLVQTLPEFDSPSIDMNINKINLLGSEYAIITVSDYINNDEIVTKHYQVKLIGEENYCYSNNGEEGFTGNEFVPEVVFDWSWNQAINLCDSDNPYQKHCDGAQFSMSLFKKLNNINQALEKNSLSGVTKNTVFYSNLIKDNYSKEFLDDFLEYYSESVFDTPDFFISSDKGLRKFIEDDKISFEIEGKSNTLLDYGGTYRVEINIDEIEKINGLFDNENLPEIKIKLTPIKKANNYNPFYETPLNGGVGKNNRVGYGASFTDAVLISSDYTADTSTNVLKRISFEEINDYGELNNEVILIFDSITNRMLLMPSQPTPVIMSVTGTDKVNASYKYLDVSAQTPNKNWKMISSNIGSSNKCIDFSGENKNYLENSSGVNKSLFWDGKYSGKIKLGAVFFTPQKYSVQPKIIPTNSSTKFLSYNYLINGESIILDNYVSSNKNYATIEDVINLVRQKKVCVSKNSSETIKFWWNKEYLNELIDEIDTKEYACN